MTDMTNDHICEQSDIVYTGGGANASGYPPTASTRDTGECTVCHARHWRPSGGGEWRPWDTYLADPNDTFDRTPVENGEGLP
jgi:hypothetical protein